jgi:hypothetical protein
MVHFSMTAIGTLLMIVDTAAMVTREMSKSMWISAIADESIGAFGGG